MIVFLFFIIFVFFYYSHTLKSHYKSKSLFRLNSTDENHIQTSTHGNLDDGCKLISVQPVCTTITDEAEIGKLKQNISF